MSKATRVLIAEDNWLTPTVLRAELEAHGYEVAGVARTGREALEMCRRDLPDVVLMDIRMPGMDGIEATRMISKQFPQTKVVMLTSHASDDLIVSAIQAGAVGYVLKQVGNAELVRAISAAARGEALLDPGTTLRLLARVRETERKAEDDAFRDLSDREMDVLAEVARGKSNAEIGRLLNLSEKTVRNYLSTIFEKLHLTNRIELATFAIEHHLFERQGLKK